MRKICLFVVLLMLTGCASEDKTLQPALLFRAELLNAGQCAFTAEVTADYGDLVYEFTMDCTAASDGTTQIAVTKPESIAGITAAVTNGTVTFEGMSLDFGAMAEGRLTPLAAPAMAVESWRSSYIASAGKTDDGYRVSFEDGFQDEKLTVDTWFSTDGQPIYTELQNDGKCLIKMNILNFKTEGSSD